MLAPLAWLITVEVLGVLAFPIAFALFSRLPDRGYTVAKPLALILVSYLLWILGMTQFIPNSSLTIISILLLATLASGWVLRRDYREIRTFVRSRWPTILAAEGVFLVFFGMWLAVASEVPAINHTEKPMDFAFLNAILQSQHFPPEDPWLSGQTISYYYFGHFMMALLIKLTSLSSPVGYNIAVSFIPALLAVASFGLLFNLVQLSGGSLKTSLGFGLVAPALLILTGNLEGILELIHSQGWGSDGFWGWAGIKGLDGVSNSAATVFPDQPWWWWRATRVIDTVVDGQSLDYTITEFPFFSFLLGDLHAHMMSLPFLVMFLALGLNLFVSREKMGPGWLIKHPVESIVVALMLGALAFINTWDFPVFAGILAMIIFAQNYGHSSVPSPIPTTRALPEAVFNTALLVVPLVLVATVLFIPFYLDLSSQASGILPVIRFGIRPFLFFLVMGLLVVLGTSFLLRQMTGLRRPTEPDAPTILLIGLVSLVPLSLWTIIVLVVISFTDGITTALAVIGSRLVLALPGALVAGLAGFSALQRVRDQREPIIAYPLLLLAMAFYLMVGAELFFLVDFFGNRMNTIFKVYFQSWLLLSIVGAYGVYYWRANWQSGKSGVKIAQYAWVAASAVLILASLYYPLGAVIDRTGLMEPGHTLNDNTLDGLSFLQKSEPGEYAAITWLRETASKGRIVEAVGGDYSDYGRISSSTGLPTILGWKGHEHQWRGNTAILDRREKDVARIYQSSDPGTVSQLLEQYDVRYVYVGSRERAKYGSDHLDKFDDFMRTVFEKDGVVVYERVATFDPASDTNIIHDPS